MHWATTQNNQDRASMNQAYQRHSKPSGDLLCLSHSNYNAQLFRTSMFSDCTIYSGARAWHLHRCILSPRCEFFWSCFQGAFEEAANAAVEMHDDDPETLDRMLKWVYCLEYPTLIDANAPWTADLMLCLMGDKYGLTGLMLKTREAILSLAVRCKLQHEILRKTVDDFAEAIEMLFVDLAMHEELEQIRSELLVILAPVIATEMRTQPKLQQLMVSIDGFGLALIEALSGQIKHSPITSGGSSLASPAISSAGSAESPPALKPYIPLNEDSEDEFE